MQDRAIPRQNGDASTRECGGGLRDPLVLAVAQSGTYFPKTVVTFAGVVIFLVMSGALAGSAGMASWHLDGRADGVHGAAAASVARVGICGRRRRGHRVPAATACVDAVRCADWTLRGFSKLLWYDPLMIGCLAIFIPEQRARGLRTDDGQSWLVSVVWSAGMMVIARLVTRRSWRQLWQYFATVYPTGFGTGGSYETLPVNHQEAAFRCSKRRRAPPSPARRSSGPWRSCSDSASSEVERGRYNGDFVLRQILRPGHRELAPSAIPALESV
jgi:hypothetical protein